jgi:hypothetical protein
LLVTASCDALFHVERLSNAIDAPPSMCMQQSFSDMFESTTPCTPWGSRLTQNMWLNEANGALSIAMTASGFDGCMGDAAMPFDEQGYFVEVDQVMQTPNAFTALMVRDMAGNTRISISEGTGLLDFRMWAMPGSEMSLLVEKPIYKPTAMKFWRLRADPTTMETVAEYSADASRWTELGRTPTRYMTNVYLVLLAGLLTGTPAPDPDTATFSHLNVCP